MISIADTEEEKESIYDSLVTYCQGDFYPYHMPGHKRRSYIDGLADVYGIDITEIDGFDNLH
ncbi:MAG: amino acid decarboxylase, partial [Lachnospiraceae bacterium]|nr:amino acid decarboxylase [Lachnospiraceae bacterium]